MKRLTSSLFLLQRMSFPLCWARALMSLSLSNVMTVASLNFNV